MIYGVYTEEPIDDLEAANSRAVFEQEIGDKLGISLRARKGFELVEMPTTTVSQECDAEELISTHLYYESREKVRQLKAEKRRRGVPLRAK